MAWSTWLAALGLAFWSFIWGLGFLGLHVAKRKFSKTKATTFNKDFGIEQPDEVLPGVSILRPLRGLDCNLYENLESSFQQRYPQHKFEIIFSVAEEDDQAIPIVKDLMERFPHVNASLIMGEEIVGVNPKINNLVKPYRAARFDMLWIVDSNVQSSPHALRRAMAAFTPASSTSKAIGLVHHVPFPVWPDTDLGSRVEQAFLSTTHAKMYLAINEPAVDSCVCGKSCLFTKTDLERATRSHYEHAKGKKSTLGGAMANLSERDKYGIAAFGEYLGEDNMIGRFIWHDAGMRHAIAPDVAANAVGNMSLEKYFWRRVRWIRVRKYMVFVSTLLEPLTESIVCGVIGGLAMRHFLSIPLWLFLILHMAAWYSLDVAFFRTISLASPARQLHVPYHDGPGSSGFRIHFFIAWAVREMSALPIWLFAMLGNKVSWRDDGKMYKVKIDGKVVETTGRDWMDTMARNCFRRIRGRGSTVHRYNAVSLAEEEAN